MPAFTQHRDQDVFDALKTQSERKKCARGLKTVGRSTGLDYGLWTMDYGLWIRAENDLFLDDCS